MTEGIINSDGSRNWQANILLDNIKRLEQENKELRARIKHQCYKCRIGDTMEDRLRSVLEEIREIAEDVESASSTRFYRIKSKINEVLQYD